jgi:hypothetical protein
MFLSKTPVTEGETVLVHTVVANESNVAFGGDVVFKDGDTKLGSVAVSIAAGGANAVSISWKPTHGSHTVVAELTAHDGSVVETETQTFTINEKPKPASSTAGTTTNVGSSQDIQNKINDVLPAATPFSEPVFATLDSARATAAKALDNGINWAKTKSGGNASSNFGKVLGTSTKSSGAVDTAWLIGATLLLYIFSVLRFVVGNAGIFYPVFALLFFYILWRTYKRFRRPRYAAYE